MQKIFYTDPELLTSIQKLKSIGGLSLKFPKCVLRNSTHQKVVESNHHGKSTNPGYIRAVDGRPYYY